MAEQKAEQMAEQKANRIPLYRKILGPKYDVLPLVIQEMHDVHGQLTARGRGRVNRGTSVLSIVAATVLRFPKTADDIEVNVTFAQSGNGERLARDYAGTKLVTRQFPARGRHAGLLVESFGPMALYIDLEATAEGLTFHMHHCASLAVTLPRALWPSLEARERTKGGLYHYFVRIGMPLLGQLIEYEGTLEPVAAHEPRKEARHAYSPRFDVV